ncbi:glycine/betaine ABC transporter [Alkalihalobacillus alcalophilus ATCC 27647 = CGMCC 1.3604]|uniref:Glycine betaine/carnitine/choline transporter n=1 Tax=Alkalihalobacillus alcalophilus ATCC 27647 = CGMCC 1.3604 TaxID=1218173 RepID=J8TPL6_ALKAL|nr:BCCT family transporter [Alkalihalobacillus alcalophilus]AFV25886.1 glycine betaine/carnitine/choline transporter [Alkalihalobacillus alcalophilus ATCC 27647 = CGMCC 1.3604]THG88370.1 glycine/betaine ABC transporter [Alkalihalobacillus alcalophilus ATCC 27647 = CGMCC 1.3604]
MENNDLNDSTENDKAITNKVGSVFYWTLGILSVLILTGIFAPNVLESVTAQAQTFISNTFGWYYLIVVTIFLIVCLIFIVSPYGKVRLGKDDDRPEYSFPVWIAFLFSAGLGVGLLFFGAAEPIAHFAVSSPNAPEGTEQAAMDALLYTFFHWGLHGWAIYAIIAICLAYFNFRKDKTGLISATLSPLWNMDGKLGKTIDVVAIVATLSGIATTLGFGALQMNGGISLLTGLPNSFALQLAIIVVVTVIFILSSMTGIDKGIKILSTVNMSLVGVVFLFLMIFGATMFSFNMLTTTIGNYIQNLPQMSFNIAPMSEDKREWINAWTIFYWAWWMAWSPFVGTFIARVSKGRTLREFVVAVLLVPSVMGFIWFSFIGGTAISVESSGTIISHLPDEEVLFGVLETMPFGTIMSYLTIFVIAVFFITSADSATFVLASQSTAGSLNPGKRIKLVWGILMSATAAVLLYSGGLQGIQNTMILVAFPFSIIMVLMVIALFKSLAQERLREEAAERKEAREWKKWRKEQDRKDRQLRKNEKKEKRTKIGKSQAHVKQDSIAKSDRTEEWNTSEQLSDNPAKRDNLDHGVDSNNKSEQ